jgi:hypothetical protein
MPGGAAISPALTPAPPGPPPAPAGPKLPGGVDPKALADPEFKLPPKPPIVGNRSPSPPELEQQALNVKNRQEMLNDANVKAGIANMVKPYLDIASDYMNSGGVITGWGAEQRQQLAKLAQTAHIPAAWLGDPDKTAVVIKNLGNSALQGARLAYGSRMSTTEVVLQLERLSANADQPAGAIKTLIKEGQAMAQYDSDTGKLAPLYIQSGGDPLKFEGWQATHHNRGQFVQDNMMTPIQREMKRRGLLPQAAAIS